MRFRVLVPFALAFACFGCETLVEEMPLRPTEAQPETPATAPLETIPIDVRPVPLPQPGDSAGTPTATPTPTPDVDEPEPVEPPDPTPTPAPAQGAACPGIQITIGARCAGLTPNCGIDGVTKTPTVVVGSKVMLDASYYIGSPNHKIHDYDPCYPGPMSGWDTPGGVHCGQPISGNHVITCGPYEDQGAYDFEVCGAGTCAGITVQVE
jgi:hypothetical protein